MKKRQKKANALQSQQSESQLVLVSPSWYAWDRLGAILGFFWGQLRILG